jgi:hypothetical protein
MMKRIKMGNSGGSIPTRFKLKFKRGKAAKPKDHTPQADKAKVAKKSQGELEDKIMKGEQRSKVKKSKVVGGDKATQAKRKRERQENLKKKQKKANRDLNKEERQKKRKQSQRDRDNKNDPIQQEDPLTSAQEREVIGKTQKRAKKIGSPRLGKKIKGKK